MNTTSHDHGACSRRALHEAEDLCARRGVRLTAVRRRVLELIWAGHKPRGAYDLLAAMAHDSAARPAPPTVYRALEFLLEQGLVHRLDSVNAYIGCPRPDGPHQGVFMVCESCGDAAEISLPSLPALLQKASEEQGFSINHSMVEMTGLCRTCAHTQEFA